jgi:uncharacterized membrane protein
MASVRSWQVALLISLAANIFAATYAFTAWNQDPAPRLLDPAPLSTGYRIADALPAPAGLELRNRLETITPSIDEKLTGYRVALAKAAALLTQPTVDAKALGALIGEARAQRNGIGDLLTEAFVATVSRLPVEDRERLIARFLKQ